ncbi:MAG: ABC transporter substrate-binding protein [Rhodospirillales bacterium]|nr:ABC transporter substrate-binding protein [Rhodospirillales bacterium]
MTTGLTASDPAAGFERRGDKKILVYAGHGDVPVIDPSIRYDAPVRTIQRAVYDALLKYVDSPPKVIPWLAESYDVNDDGKTYTFHLVKNAKFHNGDPVTAEAVRWSFERTLKLKQGVSWMLADVLPPENIAVVDDHTARMTLNRPYAPFASFIPWWFIMNPKETMAHAVDDDYGAKWLLDHDTGSGPYKVVRAELGKVWELERVEDYWRGFDGPLDGIIYEMVREKAVQSAGLEKGDIDIVTGLTPDSFDRLSKLPGIKASTEPALTAFGLKFNTQTKYMSDVNIRKAVAYAYDYDAFIKIFNNRAKLQTSPFADAVKGKIDVPNMPRRDIAKAKEYLAKSQWPDGGIELEFVYVSGFGAEQQMGLVLIDALRPLNIKVNMVPLSWTAMLQRGATAETSPDIIAIFVTPVSTDPDATAGQYHPDAWGQYWGVHFYDNPELKQLIEEGRRTIAWKDHEPIYRKIQQILVDGQPEVYGMMRERMIMYRDWVGGFEFSPVMETSELDLYPLYIE